MSDWEKVYKEAILETAWSKIENLIRLQSPRLAHDYTNFLSTAAVPQKKISG
jgi:hypothetical protein